jgi:hypothetical protein
VLPPSKTFTDFLSTPEVPVDAFFAAQMLGCRCATLDEFDAFLVELGLDADGPLAALLRLEYQASLAQMKDYQQATFHKLMVVCSVAAPC